MVSTHLQWVSQRVCGLHTLSLDPTMIGQEGKETEGALEYACLGDSGIEGQSKITALRAASFSEAAQLGVEGEHVVPQDPTSQKHPHPHSPVRGCNLIFLP